MFNVSKETQLIVNFIKEYFKKNPSFKGAVVGMSGGKDSTVAAVLCARALGADNVLGVLMPNGVQSDIDDARLACKVACIKSIEINIKPQVESAVLALSNEAKLTEVATMNIAPRVRMLNLYAVAQSMNMLVSCNSNLSELTVGYTTKWGDSAGDFAPLAHLTKSEVVEVGKHLGIPDALILKKPADGLSNKTDEESLGFTYFDLDRYIRFNTGELRTIEKIKARIKDNTHKRTPIPVAR